MSERKLDPYCPLWTTHLHNGKRNMLIRWTSLASLFPMVDFAIAQWQTHHVDSVDDVIGQWAAVRGGVHQRLDAVAVSGLERPSAAPRPPSTLASRLSELNAWALCSAERVQDLASSAISDGSDHPELRALAALGAHGAHSQTCSRDLRTLYKPTHPNLPEPFVIAMPIFDAKAKPPRVVCKSVKSLGQCCRQIQLLILGPKSPS